LPLKRLADTSDHDWTPHHLRRTASRLMGLRRVTRFIIDRVLNHTDATVGGIGRLAPATVEG